mgnify:CR=1 FL=1
MTAVPIGNFTSTVNFYRRDRVTGEWNVVDTLRDVPAMIAAPGIAERGGLPGSVAEHDTILLMEYHPSVRKEDMVEDGENRYRVIGSSDPSGMKQLLEVRLSRLDTAMDDGLPAF